MGPAVKYARVPMNDRGPSSGRRRRAPSQRVCCSLLPAAQVAAGLLPIGFCDTVLAEHWPVLLAGGSHQGDDWQWLAGLIARLATPVAALLLSPALGVLSERAWSRGDCSGLHKLLAWHGLVWAAIAQLLLFAAFDLGLLFGDPHAVGPVSLAVSCLGATIYAIARAALQVSFHARAAESVPVSRLGSAFALTSMLWQVGELLGRLVAQAQWGKLGYFSGLATQACGWGSRCFDMRVGLLTALVLTLLGCPLAALATVNGDVGRQQRRKQQVQSAASSPRSLPSRHSGLAKPSDVEAALRDPGARAILVAAGLAWAGWWALEVVLGHFVTKELVPGSATTTTLRDGRSLGLCVGISLAALLPRLTRTLGAFGLLLTGALFEAALLLLAPALRANPGKRLVTLWLTCFGLVHALLLAMPPAIAARRARARSTPVAVAMAIICVPGPAAQVSWEWLAEPVRRLLGSDVAVLCAGGACSVWAAVICSRAMACDRDGQRPLSRDIGRKQPAALALPGLASRRSPRI